MRRPRIRGARVQSATLWIRMTGASRFAMAQAARRTQDAAPFFPQRMMSKL
jgi:hypothetical protein